MGVALEGGGGGPWLCETVKHWTVTSWWMMRSNVTSPLWWRHLRKVTANNRSRNFSLPIFSVKFRLVDLSFFWILYTHSQQQNKFTARIGCNGCSSVRFQFPLSSNMFQLASPNWQIKWLGPFKQPKISCSLCGHQASRRTAGRKRGLWGCWV